MKNKKLALLVLLIGILLILGGLSLGIYTYITKKNEDNKKIEDTVLKEYEIFRANAESFDDFRMTTYYNDVVKDLYPESVETEYENWITVLDSYTDAIDKVENASNYLKENCVNKYYSNNDIKNKCDSFVIAYETAINYYTKNIITFNETIEAYLKNIEEEQNKIKTYELKYNYVDINADGKFYGKD